MGAIVQNGLLTLAELRSATCGLETVLKFSVCRFSLIFRAFSGLHSAVVLSLNQRNRYFFNHPLFDGVLRSPLQATPLAYYTLPWHRCP